MKLLFHGVGVYREGQTFGPACWPHHDLFVVREGQAAFYTAAGTLMLKRGDSVLIPPGIKFEGEPDGPECLLWVIHFRAEKGSDKQLPILAKKALHLSRGRAGSELARQLMDRLHQLYLGDSQWRDRAETFLAALLADLYVLDELSVDRHEQWIADLERLASEKLGTGVSIKTLADSVNLSPSHFRKLFLQRRGMSVGKFVQDLRLKKAQSLLTQSALSLKQLSAELGYSDAVAFTRAFTNRFGVPPGRFRQQNKVA